MEISPTALAPRTWPGPGPRSAQICVGWTTLDGAAVTGSNQM